MKPVGIGVIGCGNISEVYLKVAKNFSILKLVAVADLIPERATAKAEAHGVAACTVDELLANPEIEIVLNLTIPAVHGQIGLKALKAGKCVYNEKPFAPTREEGTALLELAQRNGLLVGGAPDTFMGAGLQTCRKIIDDGWIGEPVAATAFFMGHGAERWHPDPEFFYKPGAGPMFDMGPYYLTALVSLIGPVKAVSSAARASFKERVIGSQPKAGQIIKVETPTHIAGSMEFASGAIATVVTSFDIWAHSLPNIEIYGTTGSLRVPDPNTFGGQVFVRRFDGKDWVEVPYSHGYSDQNRSIGLADMAFALRTGRPFRPNGKLAYHVLDVMHSFLDSARERRHVDVASTCERPAALGMGLHSGDLSD